MRDDKFITIKKKGSFLTRITIFSKDNLSSSFCISERADETERMSMHGGVSGYVDGSFNFSVTETSFQLKGEYYRMSYI